MVQEVRREEGLEVWRPLERVVEVSDDEVFDLWWEGLDRFSDSGRCDFISVGLIDPVVSTEDF